MSRAPRARITRNWGDDDSCTPILHVDMDAFFVSVELLERPHLRGQPVAVGGAERGVVSAASYEARNFGVNSAMSVAQAKRLCPHLIMIPPRHGVYSEVSRRIMEILSSYTPTVEQVSVDEAFLDVSTDKVHTPSQIAAHLRWKIRTEEHVPASVGIAATKHVAKIASAHAKPDGMLLIPASATEDFLRSLPLGAIWGVGEVMRRKLEKAGLATVDDIYALDRSHLAAMLGAAGEKLWDLSHGIDPRPVVGHREEKSIGKENTFFDVLTDRDEVLAHMLDQSYACARRLRQKGLMARRVTIKIRSAAFTTITRSHTLAAPTDLAREIYRIAAQLLEMPGDGVRLIGVRAESLEEGATIQGILGDDGRVEKAERTLDSIREKFGHSSAGPGTLLPRENNPRYDGGESH